MWTAYIDGKEVDGFIFGFDFNTEESKTIIHIPASAWNTYQNAKISQIARIKVGPHQPINTSMFELAVVHENSQPSTAQGI